MESNQSMVPISYLSESSDLTSESSDSELSLCQAESVESGSEAEMTDAEEEESSAKVERETLLHMRALLYMKAHQ